MNASTAMRYAGLIPGIEAAIREHKLDTLVLGLGPTAWLLPWMDQGLVRPLRTYGVHDACRIYPVDDLVLMDDGSMGMNPAGSRIQHVIDARPRKVWVYAGNFAFWQQHLHPAVHPLCEAVNWKVHAPQELPRPEEIGGVDFRLHDERPHTSLVSPLGAVTLAWKNYGHRIGVLGVDMLPEHHHTGRGITPMYVDHFFTRIAQEAHAAGGCIVNLSPISSLQSWRRIHFP